MYLLIIFAICLFPTSSNQNLINNVTLDDSFSNSSNSSRFEFYRCPRGLGNKANKPMDCHRLHATEDTPFIAIILNRASGRLICMGSIIDEKHVLTAYKCIQNTNPSSLRILIGYFKAYWGRHSQVLFVEKVVKHEHDLVILKLKRRIVFSRTVKAITLLRLEDGKSKDEKPPPKAKDDSKIQNTVPDALKELQNHNGNSNKSNKSSNKIHQNKEDSSSRTLGKENEFNKNDEELKLQNNETSELFNETEAEYDEKDMKKVRKRILYGLERKDHSLSSAESEQLTPRQGGTATESKLPSFSETHPDIKEFLLVGFPLSSLDAVGDAISQTLVYGMKEEKLGKEGTDCLKIYEDKPALEEADDPDAPKRVFCTDGTSKFCWGCLGGPTLYKKEQEYIQVGVVGGTNCDKDENYLHIRVDINMKWISMNSLIADRK